MKASYRWICELLPELRASADEVAERLTALGLAVDGITHYGAASRSCQVVQVTAVRPHPQRSNLRLVTVAARGGAQEVVCGAPNVPEPGGLVVLAPLGAELPAKNLKIEPRKIGGIESQGMLCSEAELGLSDDEAGILVLPPGLAQPGTPLAEALPASYDVIYELDVTPNRPDALGHVGIARDLAAAYGIHWQLPLAAAEARPDAPAVESCIQVRIDDSERCPHFGAAVVTEVKVGPSPAWLRYRLFALGVRSISNLVDITNLLMFEFGHPMHAYDLDHVGGAQIIVRRARDGETLKTLDGVERKLVSDDLVICDAQRTLGLGGVMGGADSEVSDQTTRVLFECAYFEPRVVRRSARRHGMHTEASHRFERGVDPANAGHVLARAMQLTEDLASGRLAQGQLHVGTLEPERRVLPVAYARVNQLIGESIAPAEVKSTLQRLGCELQDVVDGLQVRVPTHRPDLLRSVDLIGEVSRIRGIDRVQTVLPPIRPTLDHGPRERLASDLRTAAVELGLQEAITFAFVSERDLQRLSAPAPSVVLKNPINEHQTVMRTSLLPGLLDAAARARRHGLQDVRLFTIGSRYLPGSLELPEERLSFAALIAGTRPSYLHKPPALDVWDAKGLAESMVLRATRQSAQVLATTADARPAHLHPRGAAQLLVDGVLLGTFGPLHPDVIEAYELDPSTFVLELDAAELARVRQSGTQFRDIPRFPPSRRDIAIVVHDDVPAGEVLEAIRAAAAPLAEQVELFDRFVGGSIAAQHASLAYRVTYRAADRTLTDAEVDERHTRVVAEIERRFAAQVRGS
jgi:phenylalanyl-tRNA synthetase beta chain